MSLRPLKVVSSEILSLQPKSAFRMVVFFAMGQMPAEMEMVSWSLEVLRTTWIAEGAFGWIQTNMLVSLFHRIFVVITNHKQSPCMVILIMLYFLVHTGQMLAVVPTYLEQELFAASQIMQRAMYVLARSSRCKVAATFKTAFVVLEQIAVQVPTCKEHK